MLVYPFLTINLSAPTMIHQRSEFKAETLNCFFGRCSIVHAYISAFWTPNGVTCHSDPEPRTRDMIKEPVRLFVTRPEARESKKCLKPMSCSIHTKVNAFKFIDNSCQKDRNSKFLRSNFACTHS